MKGCLLILALIVALGTPASAQSFGPPLPTELILVLLDREGNVRFTLSGYYADWENPFRVRETVFSDLLGRRVTKEFRLIANTPASPLFEGKYVLSRRWSVGLWYNPIRGERLRRTVQVEEVFVELDLERDTDLADLHVIYAGGRGLTVQLGYYLEWGRIRDRNSGAESDYTLQSANLWVTQRLDVFVPGRLVDARRDAQWIPFLSAGYHPAAEMNRAVSLLAGVAVTFRERISLSGTLWLFDLTDPNHTATRITGGLVIQY